MWVDGIKVVPLSEVATKDDFFNIKKVSAADLLDTHRVPFQLMGGKPVNIGSMGDVEKVARVFVRNELTPLQERFKEINDWLGMEVIRFKDNSLRYTTRRTILRTHHRRPAKHQRRHDAHRRIKLNAVTTSGAQCYPRLGCPLDGLVLMQVHYKFRTK